MALKGHIVEIAAHGGDQNNGWWICVAMDIVPTMRTSGLGQGKVAPGP